MSVEGRGGGPQGGAQGTCRFQYLRHSPDRQLRQPQSRSRRAQSRELVQIKVAAIVQRLLPNQNSSTLFIACQHHLLTKQIHPEQYIYDVQTIYLTIICPNLLT